MICSNSHANERRKLEKTFRTWKSIKFHPMNCSGETTKTEYRTAHKNRHPFRNSPQNHVYLSVITSLLSIAHDNRQFLNSWAIFQDGLVSPPAPNSPQELNVFHTSSEGARIVRGGLNTYIKESRLPEMEHWCQFKSCIFWQNAGLETSEEELFGLTCFIKFQFSVWHLWFPPR